MKATQQTPPVSAPRRRSRQAPEGENIGPLHDYSKMPNSYLTTLVAQHKLAGALERDILFVILMHTWGSFNKQEYAELSMRQMAKLCDDADSTNVARSTQRMGQAGIIHIRERKGCARTTRGYKLTPEGWKDAPAYEPPKLQQTAADPEEQPDEDEDDPIFPGTRNCSKLLIRPGCKPRPVAARLAPKDKDPVDFRIECSNTGFDPVEFSATTDADVLRISFQSRRRKSEATNQAEAEKPAKEKRKTAVSILQHSPSVRHSDVENKRSSEFELVVKTLLASEFSKSYNPALPADQKFIERILENAGPDLTAADYQSYCRKQLRTMIGTLRKDAGSGLLLSFASQAAALPRPSAPSPTPANAPEPALASAEDVSELLDLCIICGGDGSGKFRGVATGKPCEPCNGTGRNPHAGGRPC